MPDSRQVVQASFEDIEKTSRRIFKTSRRFLKLPRRFIRNALTFFITLFFVDNQRIILFAFCAYLLNVQPDNFGTVKGLVGVVNTGYFMLRTVFADEQ